MVNERWLNMIAEERIRDIQREAAKIRLVKEARQSRARFGFSLRWFRLPSRPAPQQESAPQIPSLT
jgi:hypothetical protein